MNRNTNSGRRAGSGLHASSASILLSLTTLFAATAAPSPHRVEDAGKTPPGKEAASRVSPANGAPRGAARQSRPGHFTVAVQYQETVEAKDSQENSTSETDHTSGGSLTATATFSRQLDVENWGAEGVSFTPAEGERPAAGGSVTHQERDDSRTTDKTSIGDNITSHASKKFSGQLEPPDDGDPVSVMPSERGSGLALRFRLVYKLKGGCTQTTVSKDGTQTSDDCTFGGLTSAETGENQKTDEVLKLSFDAEPKVDGAEQSSQTDADWNIWYGLQTTRMPDGGYKLTYSGTRTSNLGSGAVKTGALTIEAFIRPGASPKAEMSIAPASVQDYNDWIPLPASPSPADKNIFGSGSALVFNAAIRPKEKNKPAQKGRIDFYLQDVSRHKGTATNYPLNAGEKDDLRFSPVQPPGVTVDPGDPKHAYTTAEVTDASVSVEAADTGAYGKLTARAEGLGLQAVYDKTGENFVAIPRDANGNHVADKWERDEGVFDKNYATNWDEDPYPDGQRRAGDGYTLYEEYRGFVTLADSGQLQKKFVRTAPLKKDIFVYDRDGLIKKYYEPYNPAQLQIHYIDNTLMQFNENGTDPSNRWVNFNSSESDWYARQYAIYAHTENLLTESGGANDIQQLKAQPKGYDAFAEPMKNFFELAVSPAGVRSQYPSPPFSPQEQEAAFQADMTTSIIHEFGHCVGIPHHRLNGVEDDATRVGGVLDCPMRYYNENDIRDFQKTRVLAPRTKYCRVGQTGVKIKAEQSGFDTVEENGVKKQVPKYIYLVDTSGTVPSDDCFHKIDVKSDP